MHSNDVSFIRDCFLMKGSSPAPGGVVAGAFDGDRWGLSEAGELGELVFLTIGVDQEIMETWTASRYL